jgi:hypothetical protein
MAQRARAVALGVAALGVACSSPPRIDTSSSAAAVASLRRVRESLPPEKRGEFDAAVKAVALARLGDEPESGEAVSGPGDRMLAPLNGMTAAEVLTEARRLRAAEKEARQAGSEARPAP